MTMKTLLERMMRSARDLIDNVTFYFQEEFYLHFLEFFGTSGLLVRPSQQCSLVQLGWWQESGAHV